MNLAEALSQLSPLSSLVAGAPRVVSFVGAGGKSSAMFRLALELLGQRRSVLVTTTTHLADPRTGPKPLLGNIVLRPEMEFPRDKESAPELGSGLTVLVSREAKEPGKMKGIHPSWIPALERPWDFVLVEADGSRRLPVKAPAFYEPVIPPGTSLVVGLIGLDCLGMPMDARTVHRPEIFSRITGCDPGNLITWNDLVSLARHPEGLFKGVRSPRVILLNKADRASFLPSESQLEEFCADLALVSTMEGIDPVLLSCLAQRSPV